MTTVATEGFNVPPAGNTIVGGQSNVPPQGMQPGFVQTPATPAAVPAQGTAPVTPDAGQTSLQAAIAALTAQLQSQTPEAAPAAVTPVASDLHKYDVGSIDDPIIRSMATVMQTVGKGVDLDRALGHAIETGRVDMVDAAYLREVGGENAEQLIAIAQGLVQAIEAKGTAVTAGVHALAGGEAGWNTSVAAFNTGAPQELRMVVAQMLDSNKENMIQAGAKLVLEFAKASGRVPNITPGLRTGAASAPQGQALDKEGFQAELRKLNPQDRQFNSARQELFARRQLGRNMGI